MLNGKAKRCLLDVYFTCGSTEDMPTTEVESWPLCTACKVPLTRLVFIQHIEHVFYLKKSNLHQCTKMTKTGSSKTLNQG